MQSPAPSSPRPIPWRALLLSFAVVSVWVNASEVFRYFAFVMPMTRQALSMVPDVAPMSWGIFMIWGAWDSLLVALAVFAYWLASERFGHGLRTVLLSGTFCWLLLFVLFWLALWNMNLADARTPLTALPLAWLEMVVAAGIARACLRRSAAP